MGEKNPKGTTGDTVENDDTSTKSPPIQSAGVEDKPETSDGRVSIEVPGAGVVQGATVVTGAKGGIEPFVKEDRLTPQASGVNGPGEPHGAGPDGASPDPHVHEPLPDMPPIIRDHNLGPSALPLDPQTANSAAKGSPGIHDYLTQALTEMRDLSRSDKASRELSIAITHVEDALSRLDKTDIR